MKNLLTILCCLITVVLSGQITSKSLSQDSILYLTPEQEAFMIDKETKYLFKTGPLAYERKLSQAFSINFELQPIITLTNSKFSSAQAGLTLESNLEIRNYFKLPSLIREGKQADNLSSFYVAAGVGYKSRVFGRTNNIFNVEKGIYFALGEQKRFLNYGYVNFGVKIEYKQRDYALKEILGYGRDSNGIGLSSFTKVGFALGKTYEISDETKCPIFKCHLDRNSAFKIDYNRTFAAFYGDDYLKQDGKLFGMKINPSISYERKIGSSAFSTVANLAMTFAFSTRDTREITIDHSIGIRYYYNLRKNIAKGKTGNNLSGFYALARYNYVNSNVRNLSQVGPNGPLVTEEAEATYLNVDLGIGYQKTLLNNLYFDIDLGLSPRAITFKSSMFDLDERLFSTFKVGKFF